jgi:hypothetical protein
VTGGTGQLFAEDIARLEGVSVKTARSRLRLLEARYGTAAVGSTCRGGTMGAHPARYTTAGALATVRNLGGTADIDAMLALEDTVAALERRVVDLERRVSDTERRGV